MHVTSHTFKKWINDEKMRENDHKKLRSHIESGKPFFVARLGPGEVSKSVDTLAKHVGVVPKTTEQVQKFRNEYATAISNCTGIGIWNERWFPTESKELEQSGLQKNVVQFHAETLGDIVYNINHPQKGWFGALQGKKILIVHPFIDTMKLQYEKRHLFYPDFPEFASIHFLRAPMTNAMSQQELLNYKSSWSQNLDNLVKEASKIDYDIALVGCGGYAMPFASRMFQEYKKSGITTCGATQLYFGIMGNRWLLETNNYQHVKDLYEKNIQFWVRPKPSERPAEWKSIEKGCYW